jgi:sugar phosphate isomerase/epimerase
MLGQMDPIRRRQLLQGTLGALLPAAGPWGCAAEPAATEPAKPTAPPLSAPLTTIGLQLYTVRDQLAADPEGTIATVAGAGYREVEFANYFQLSPADWKGLLDGHGLTAPGAHFHLDVFQTSFEAVLENALILGHQYLVMPFTPPELRSAEGYRQMAMVLNDAGAIAAPRGVRVAFHNHDFDFEPLPGETTLGYDILAGELDPSLVDFELDTYWIEIAGQSTISYFQRYAGRYSLCHLKDTTSLLAMQDVGYGTLDWSGIVAAARAAGVQHFFVEHDQAADPFASIRRSYGYLSGTAS